MPRVNLNFYKVLELPAEPIADSVYYILDEDNEIASWYVTTSEGVAIPASDPAALDAIAAAAVTASKSWTVVNVAAEEAFPTAADSGKYYRLTHDTPTFHLPTTGLVIGKTEFWLTFAGLYKGAIEAGTGNQVDFLFNDNGTFLPFQSEGIGEIYNFRLFHLRYVAANVWASDVICAA